MPVLFFYIVYNTDVSITIEACHSCVTLLCAANGNHLKTTRETGNPRAQWRLEGNKIVNGLGEALDIRGKSNHDGAEVISYKYENHANQHWLVEYV